MLRLTKLISISIMPDFLREVEKVAKEENRTKSELIREALRRYIEDREWEKLTRYARIKSAETGIKTEEDIQRVVDESRGEQSNA
jgi:CopG family transcriptional regulator / antitoxin EndoAI